MQHSTAKWRRRPFCCESSQRLFENYYARQAGGNDIPIFTGQQNQKGYGLGAILKSFFRRFILPIFVEGPVRKTPSNRCTADGDRSRSGYATRREIQTGSQTPRTRWYKTNSSRSCPSVGVWYQKETFATLKY